MSPILLDIVIPSLNAGAALGSTLAALRQGCGENVFGMIVIAEAGDVAATSQVATPYGAVVVRAAKGRGHQIRAAISCTTSPWLFVCHADSMPSPDWGERLQSRVARHGESAAYYFDFLLDDRHVMARLVEWGVALRCRVRSLPYGDQGLIIARSLYETVGGYRDWPLFEDVAMSEALGSQRLKRLGARMTTSAQRYRSRGFLHQVLANRRLLAHYRKGVDPVRLAHFYENRDITKA
jgi:glycosyltransferase involved in cell wall biosynthesis